MTGLGVERMPRTPYPPSSVSPTGACSPLPPLIQGAERRTERHARRTGVRWSLRVLVVGGLAGAAWLLTGAAAQAADRADEPVGSLLGSVLHSDTTAPVTGLLEAAAQPLETAGPAGHKQNVVQDILDVPRRVLTRPVETLDEITHGDSGTPVDAAIDGVDQVLREVAGPLRLTDGPTATQQRLTAVTAAVTDLPEPAGEEPQQPAFAPVNAVIDPMPSRSDVDQVAAQSRDTIRVAKASRSTIGTTLRAPVTVPRTVLAGKHGKAAATPSAHRHKVVAHAVTAEPATAPADLPGGDGPAAPLRLHLGDVSGTPASSWSGTPTEGGSAAFLPAAIVSSTLACQLLPIASDVEVRRCDAEAPTVSPD